VLNRENDVNKMKKKIKKNNLYITNIIWPPKIFVQVPLLVTNKLQN